MIDDNLANFIKKYHHLLFNKKEPKMADGMKVCRNKRCMMHQVILETNRNRCGSCNGKLKPYDYQHDSPEQPILRDQLMLTDDKGKSDIDDGPMVFQSDCDITGCPIAPKPTISIPFSLYTTWIFLCQKYGVEWIAYLKGSIESSGDITLADDGMYFPIQKATGMHVDAEQNSVVEGTVASIHSHVGMPAFFSQEDQNHFNHPADLVINRKGEIECVMRKKLECGRFSRVKALINFVGTTDDVGAVATLKKVLTIEKEPPQSASTVVYRDGSRISSYSRTQHGLALVDNRYANSHTHSDDDAGWSDDPRNKHS